jgi:hypothetical protein
MLDIKQQSLVSLIVSGRQLTFLHQSDFRCRTNIGATHSSRISESNIADRPQSKMGHFTRNMQNRKGQPVKKCPVWAKLAVETNEDQERFE